MFDEFVKFVEIVALCLSVEVKPNMLDVLALLELKQRDERLC